MARGIPSFHPHRLTQAREARGLSGVNLANLIGVSASTISQYEHDASKPNEETLDRLGLALNVPRTFFLRAPLEYPQSRFFYRSMSAATKAARTRAEARFEWLREIVHYFEGYFDLPSLNLPQFDLPSSFRLITDKAIEDCAIACRAHWGLSRGPAPSMIRLLEKNGFVVSCSRLDSEKLDAFSESDSAGRPFVILGIEKESCARSRFDAAHELAHCILHRGVDQRSLLSTRDYSLIENQAHRFASAFLLPEADFLRDLIAPTLESFAALKERWKVSIAAMIMRCSELEMLTEQQSEKLWVNLSRRGWKRKEPHDERLLLEQPKLLRQCIDMVLQANVKTRSQIADDLGLPKGDVEELAGLPADYLTEGFGEIISLHFKGERPAGNFPADVIPFKIG